MHPVFDVIHDLVERHASPNVGQHEEVGRVEIDPFITRGIEEHDGIWVELQVPRGRGASDAIQPVHLSILRQGEVRREMRPSFVVQVKLRQVKSSRFRWALVFTAAS